MSEFTRAAWTPRGCVELAHYGLPSMISHLFKGLLALELQNIWFVLLLLLWKHALRLAWTRQIPFILVYSTTKAKNNKTYSPFLVVFRSTGDGLVHSYRQMKICFLWIALWTVGEWCFSPAAQKHSGWWRCFALCVGAVPCEKVRLAISSSTSQSSLRENCNTKVTLFCTLFWWFTVALKVKRQPVSEQSERTGTKHTLVVFHVAPRWGWHTFPLEHWQWMQHSMPFPPD